MLIAFNPLGAYHVDTVVVTVIHVNDPPVVISNDPDEDTIFTKKSGYIIGNVIPNYTAKDTFSYITGEKQFVCNDNNKL